MDTDSPPPPYDAPSLTLCLTPDRQTNKLLITLTPPAVPPNATRTRASLDICCVIDVSGSMDASAPAPGDAGSRESAGLTVLDIVRHSLKTIITTMKEGGYYHSSLFMTVHDRTEINIDDRIALVTFSDRAEVRTADVLTFSTSII